MTGVAHYQVQRAAASTTRSSLDLLTLPYPFSQVGLLTAGDFADQANRRRSRGSSGYPQINTQILEELHRHGVLTPLFRVDLAAGGPDCQIDVSKSLTLANVYSSVLAELYIAASEGRAIDPASDEFRPWPSKRLRVPWPTYESGYLYSRHQLLGFDAARSYLTRLIPERTGEHTIAWRLDPEEFPNAGTVEALSSWRSLAIALSALDTYFWPSVTRTIRNSLTVWRSVWTDFDVEAMLSWLGMSVDQVIGAANSLKAAGTFRDDLGDFYDIVRRATAETWDSLRGDALAALDFRLAADVFEHLAQEAPGERPARSEPPLSLQPLSHQALSDRPHSLDAALTNLQLSPYPSLVIGVEGETEYRIIPRVMDLLGIEFDRNLIEIVDFGGTKDLTLLARYAAEPMLGRVHGDWVELDRPITRFLVLTDAENKFKTVADRHKQRKNLLKSLTQNVPVEWRRDLLSYRLRARTVEIRTWGPLPFEFAHFNDDQLADALLQVASAPHPGGRAGLVTHIRRERMSSSPNIDDVKWRACKISKPDLADAMWPILEQRIRRAMARGHKGPPVMKAVIRAYEMLHTTPRGSTVLRRHSGK